MHKKLSKTFKVSKKIILCKNKKKKEKNQTIFNFFFFVYFSMLFSFCKRWITVKRWWKIGKLKKIEENFFEKNQ